MMPGMSGLEFCVKFRELGKIDIPILFSPQNLPKFSRPV